MCFREKKGLKITFPFPTDDFFQIDKPTREMINEGDLTESEERNQTSLYPVKKPREGTVFNFIFAIQGSLV